MDIRFGRTAGATDVFSSLDHCVARGRFPVPAALSLGVRFCVLKSTYTMPNRVPHDTSSRASAVDRRRLFYIKAGFRPRLQPQFPRLVCRAAFCGCVYFWTQRDHSRLLSPGSGGLLQLFDGNAIRHGVGVA